jgi:hypothetical protein
MQKHDISRFSQLLDDYITAKMRNRTETPDLVLPEIQRCAVIETAEGRDVPDGIVSELQFFQIGELPKG